MANQPPKLVIDHDPQLPVALENPMPTEEVPEDQAAELIELARRVRSLKCDTTELTVSLPDDQ